MKLEEYLVGQVGNLRRVGNPPELGARVRKLGGIGLLCALCLSAVIIDQIAVVAGNNAITESQINREIRLTAFVNGEKPDFSAASKRSAADRLINQTLVRQEMEASRYPPPPPGSEAQLLDQIKDLNKLPEYGLTEGDLKAFLLWQVTFLQFVDLRFRPGIQIQESEVRAYFDKQGLPQSEYAERHDQIEQKLTEEQVDRALDEWLKATRARTKIEFRKEAFQ